MSQVTKIEAAPPAPLTPMEMLDRAVSNGAGMETLEKLMALQERWEKNNARRAFDEAIAQAKAEIPVIIKTRTGHNEKKFADFASIARVVDPIITKHGLSYRFRTTQDDRIHVTCVLSHRDGHSEETTLAGPPDATGNKNAIQAIGSTLTYLQRYSLTQALGLAASEDTDGAGASDFDDSEWTHRIANAFDLPTMDKIAADLKAAKDVPDASLKLLRSAWAQEYARIKRGEKHAAEG